LFQRITATVQQAKYSEGSYELASELATGKAEIKSQFLSDALTDANTVLMNSGEQSVKWDKTGITVTDVKNPVSKLKLVSGAILLSDVNDAGDTIWKTAITPKGISADLLTAGKINTGEILIYNGNHPTFQWNSLGLTAYYFDQAGGIATTPMHSKGVRFDRFGIYGFNVTGKQNAF
jgi:hypothetical protein